ncbi:MAG: hypothetical protein ABH854_04905 [Candidatus Diapherotrites archaeon]|nr:hypothetical protein [Candidatus Micrarchaeota archaeon]MBU1939349.1 hypothetical protein [Candidatus Micrarchaeota archaeon]
MLFKRIICTVILIALILPIAQAAVSLGDAVNFVSNERHFLYGGETVEQLVTPVKHGEQEYWVVPVISGSTPATYFAVKTSEKEIEGSKVANRAIFTAADTLRELGNEKERFSKNPQVDWIITGAYANKFETLGRLLEDEIFEMETIAAEMGDAEAIAEAMKLAAQLKSMSDKCRDIGVKISEAAAFETEFTTQPDTSKTKQLGNKFGEALLPIVGLKDDAITYVSESKKLKSLISKSALDLSTRSYLQNLASPPENFNNIGNYAQFALELDGVITGLETRVSTRSDGLLDDFETRQGLDGAWDELYGEDETLRNKTSGNFGTLNEAAESLLNEETSGYWKDQARLGKFRDNWRKAEKFFTERDYKLAVNYAEKAKGDAIAVYKEGYESIGPEPLLDNETIMQIVVALVVLLVVVYAISKRDKIMEMLSPANEEVDVHGFSKR